MVQNPRAIKGMLNESMVRKLIDISKLDPNTRLLTGCYLGDCYPVETSLETSENLITINIPVPRIVGIKNKRIDDSREGSLSIKKLRGETHIVSLDLRTFGNLYTDLIDISDDVLNALVENTRDSCGMFHIGRNRLMSILYDDGCTIDLTGGYIVAKEAQPIVEFLSAGYKNLIAQRAGEDELVAEAVEQEEPIDAEIVDEEKPVPPEKTFDPKTKVPEGDAMQILGKSKENYRLFCKNNPDLVEEDGGMTHGNIAKYAVGSRGSRLKPGKRLDILKEVNVNANNLEDAAKLLKEYNIVVVPGIGYKRAPVEEEPEQPESEIGPEFLEERYTISEINEEYGIDKKILQNAVFVTHGLKTDSDRKISIKDLTNWILGLRTTRKTPESERVKLFNSVYQTEFTDREQARAYINSQLGLETEAVKKKLV
jgi:hypothetical protein